MKNLELHIFKIIMGGFLSLGVAFFTVFLLLNVVLGCESWDSDLWTERNSCVTFGMLLDFK